MPSRRVRVRYWLFDAKQLTFWLTVAFVAGAGPNLADAIHPIFLLIVTVVAALIAAALWIQNERKSGIGVYIHLPRTGDNPTSEALLSLVAKTMKKRHRDWFRSGPDTHLASSRERVEWAIKTIEHRLQEADVLNDSRVPIFFYLHCRLEEAFNLGHSVSNNWEAIAGTPAIHIDTSTHPRISLDFRVRSLSMYGNESGVVYGLNLSDIAKAANEPYIIEPELVTQLQRRYDVRAASLPQLALILYAGPRANFASFRASALEAASGRSGRGYLTNESDICDNAIVASIRSDAFFDALQRQDAEKYIRQIFRYWREKAGEVYGRSDIPVRVFMNAPSILAFAVGAFAPEGSVLVSYDHAIAFAYRSNNDASDRIIAIVDGDDVGNGMESNLLSDRLGEAARYSRQINESLSRVEQQVSRIPEVEAVATGGDSAIFRFPPTSLEAFIKLLDRLRTELSFPMSCGYGYNSREAYIALRIAKSSGKNRTQGNLDTARLAGPAGEDSASTGAMPKAAFDGLGTAQPDEQAE